MNGNVFYNGRFISFLFYFNACIVAAVKGFMNTEIPLPLHMGCCALMAGGILALVVAKPGIRMKQSAYEKLQCVMFILTDVILGYVFNDFSLILILFLVQSLLLVIFLDRGLYYFQTAVIVVVFFATGTADSIGKIPFGRLTSAHVLGVICVFAVQLVCINVVHLFNSQKRHMVEQEQSLDDILRILEVKCLEARQATQSKTDFLSNMSHEIRTPINSVLGMNEMILRESRDDNIREYASNIDSSGRMLLSLINDVLDFSKIESGHMEIVPTIYRTGEFLNGLLNMIWVPAREKGLGLVLEIDKSLPQELFGDDVRLRQVFTNLLTNAIKYTEEGTVTLRIEGEFVNEFKIVLHCEVRDTGIGIKEEDLPDLFKVFRRLEDKKTRHILGTGLGLPITFRILERMGSQLKVDSEYGVGSVFSFSLEQDIVDETPIHDIKSMLQNHASSREYKAALYAPDARVLVVDDNEMNRKVFVNLLKAPHIQVVQAESGAACLAMLKETSFDLIFLDHMMPEMDGIETLHKLRAEEPDSRTPVVALTANAISGAREMYLAEGFDGFLSKPIMPDKLESLLMDMLPPEKLLELPEQEKISGNPEAGTGVVEFPDVDGLDWGFAGIHFTDSKMLLHTVQDFYKIVFSEADKLEACYRRLEEEGQMELYQVQVHGMKSAAALIGIIPLSGCAKILEDAAKRKDRETLDFLTPLFLREWRGFRERLAPLAEQRQNGESLVEDNSELMALLGMLQGAADTMDLDTMDEIAGKLPQYRLPEDAGALDRLLLAVTNLETDTIATITGRWMDEIRGK